MTIYWCLCSMLYCFLIAGRGDRSVPGGQGGGRTVSARGIRRARGPPPREQDLCRTQRRAAVKGPCAAGASASWNESCMDEPSTSGPSPFIIDWEVGGVCVMVGCDMCVCGGGLCVTNRKRRSRRGPFKFISLSVLLGNRHVLCTVDVAIGSPVAHAFFLGVL